ncbi:unnamed protein product [Caenorhabditis angaria]|uniref:Death domain-containing protein n=1 Tax=Caenorhabditis angaria TaxID=860376 RepID=A0A9P1I4T8_9PELO|nr:unnamed protein product [Caenorhabditis angaria]
MSMTDNDSPNDSTQKSRSDSEIRNKVSKSASSSHRRILIDDISSCEGSAGDRIWAICSGINDQTIEIKFMGPNINEENAVDLMKRNDVLMFTIPHLKIEIETNLELKFIISNENFTTIPFKYVPISNNIISLSDNLVEFATTGDAIHLLNPFVGCIKKSDSEGDTVLHIASKSSQSFALKLLLSVIPPTQRQEIINLQNKHGLTALHCAIRAGDPDAVHYLLNHGALINIKDSHGNTCLHYLGDAYNESIFKEILEPPRGQTCDLNQLNNEGFSPLHIAVRRLKLSLIDMLLEAGVLIDLLDREKQRNALMHAIEMNDFETIQYLIEKGSNTNFEDTNNDTCLSLAVKNINYPVIGLLLDNGADPHKKNGKGICLADSEDEVIQKIMNGERPEFPKKDCFTVPTDLATSRSPLFGRSHPDNAPNEEFERNRIVKRTREEILNDAQSLLDEPDVPMLASRAIYSQEENEEDENVGPSTSSGHSGSRRTRDWETNKQISDSVSNLDYLTRIRVAKIFDDQAKWQRLAEKLQCDHMVELISICSAGDESSPTMILLDQFEQLTDSSITKLRSAMDDLEETEGVKLIDQRFVY